MSDIQDIYIKLLDEGTGVWRPVKAEHLKENMYRILPQQYSQETEVWQFEPGDTVICEMIVVSEGKILAAVRLA